MATVAACIIAKNESRFIRQCLDSIIGAVDKIIVVDTGSTDDTVDIIKSYPGVELRHFKWDDSFADARNESIRDCGTDYFFQIDADEILYPEHRALFKQEIDRLAAAGLDGALMSLHNAVTDGADPKEVFEGKARHGTPSQVPRITRNGPGVKYVGNIHEDTSQWLMAHGLKIGFLGAHLIHYGATKDVVISRDKIQRNVGLLKKRIEDEPSNITMYGYLTLEMLNRYPDEDVYDWCLKGWAHAETRKVGGTLSRLGVVKATLEHRRAEYDKAFQTLELLWSVDGPNADSDFLAGLIWESIAVLPETSEKDRLRCFLEALSYYQFAINPLPWEANNFYIGGSSGYLALSRMGWCFYYLAKNDDARRCFERALELDTGCQDARNGLATLNQALQEGI